MDSTEWAHPSAGFEVLGPDGVAELADDGDNGGGTFYAVRVGGCVLYGSSAELRQLLLQAHNALPAARGGHGDPSMVDRLPPAPSRRPAGS